MEKKVTKADEFARISIQKILEDIPLNSLVDHNCFWLDPKDTTKHTLSSPFVAAISGLILCEFKRDFQVSTLLCKIDDSLSEYLDPIGLPNFIEGKTKDFDIDTLAVVSLYFKFRQSKKSTHYLDFARSVILSNRDHNSGAFKTWIDRRKNIVDYCVNLNVYAFFCAIGYRDSLLEDFLIKEEKVFIKSGSHYYRDLSFPSLLVKLYRRLGVLIDKKSFLSKLEYSSSFDRTNVYSHELELNGQSELQCYFNSSTKVFHSTILDKLIGLFFESRNQLVDPLHLPIEQLIKGPI